MVEDFTQIGIGQWFRYLTGILEVSEAMAVLIPKFRFCGALLMAVVMWGDGRKPGDSRLTRHACAYNRANVLALGSGGPAVGGTFAGWAGVLRRVEIGARLFPRLCRRHAVFQRHDQKRMKKQ
jgi:hypothetical protein